jgi:WD40 repeat protein/antitoxin component HigA of HigAB toxin-antitoxin module
MVGQDALQLIDHLIEQQNQLPLRDVQRMLLLQTLQNLSYQEIAQNLGYDPDYIKQVAAQLWKLISELMGVSVSKKNIASILSGRQLLRQVDWGEAIDVSRFYGRHDDLQILANWILDSNCRLVSIIGLGGIGKTALAIKIAEQVQPEFESLIWRSLRHLPTPDNLLQEILSVLTGSVQPRDSNAALNELLQQLKKKRCLLMLDNVESILQGGDRSGEYLSGYEIYGQIFSRIADENHSSCLIFTGREKPQSITNREGSNLPVRSLQLGGISDDAALSILHDKGVIAADRQQQILSDYLSGNPLALQLSATAIQNLFAGDIEVFLAQNSSISASLWYLLEQQFERLSPTQQQIMYLLAINREGLSPLQIHATFLPALNFIQLLSSLETLRNRSLIEATPQGLTQQPVIMEYVTEHFLNHIEEELLIQKFSLFKTHSLIKSQAPDYLREAQSQIILQPIIDRLTNSLLNIHSLQQHLWQILELFRYKNEEETGYIIGNLINLLCHTKADFQNRNLSNLVIRQAHFAQMLLHNVDFRGSKLSQTVFTETCGNVIDITFSYNGQLLATSYDNGAIQVWDANTMEQKACFTGHLFWTWSINFSPDGRFLISAGDDGLVKLWDVLTEQCLHIYEGHQGFVNSASFSPDGKMIASCGNDPAIRLWQSFFQAENPEIRTLTGHSGRIWQVEFSPDGQTLVSGGEDYAIGLWDVASGKCKAFWQAHESWVRCVKFSPDGKSIASGSFDHTIKIWDAHTQKCLHHLHGHQSAVSAISYSPDGQQLVSSSLDRTIKIWDVNTGKCLRTLFGHTARVWSVTFHPDGRFIASGGDDHSMKLWDLQLGRCVKTVTGHTNAVLSLAVSPNGRYLASGYDDASIKIWDIISGQVVAFEEDHTNRLWSVQFSPNGKLLASGSADYTIKLRDSTTGKCLQILEGCGSWVWAVAFSPDSQTLVSGSCDRVVRIWDTRTGECLQHLHGHVSQVVAVAFSPNGKLVASAGLDGIIQLWNVATGECCHQFQGQNSSSVWSVAFSSDGQWLVTAGYNQAIRLWSVVTGECSHTFLGHQASVVKAYFSPDDRWIVSAGIDNMVRIWDIKTGECIRTLQGHDGLIQAITIATVQLKANSPAQLVIFSGSLDETIKIWDLESTNCLATWRSLRPYEGAKIDRVQGLSVAQETTLRKLGAVNTDELIAPRLPLVRHSYSIHS